MRIPLCIVPADVVEDVLPGETPLPYLERVVADKLSAVRGLARAEACSAFLVADTTVVLDAAILGKPADVVEAEALLTRLAGRTHTVFTRYALARADSAEMPARSRTVESRVTLRSASAPEIRRYAETGEGLDKAGAYAVQGIGAFLIERIDGSYSNVVGLPACEVILDLIELGLLERFP
jgi:septum formation protein